jgi:hypothetical protein
MCLKLWCLSTIIRTMFTFYFVLQGPFYFALHRTVDCWVAIAGLLYDLTSCLNSILGLTHYLDRMTRWDHPSPTRLQEITGRRKSQRLRSPMIYVRATKRGMHTSSRLWRKGRLGRHASKLLLIYCHTSLAQTRRIKDFMRFDTDSFPIGVDNCATYCLTDNKHDFVGPLRRSNIRVAGIGGHQDGQWVGTIKWPVVDDDGKYHELLIPNKVLVPSV